MSGSSVVLHPACGAGVVRRIGLLRQFGAGFGGVGVEGAVACGLFLA